MLKNGIVRNLNLRKLTSIVIAAVFVMMQTAITAEASGYDNFNTEISFKYSQRSYGQGAINLGANNSGRCTIEADITPTGNNIDCFLGYTDSSTALDPQNVLNNMASMIIRLNAGGTFDVLNGSSYQAVNSISYTANTTYHVKISTDLTARKYSVWIKAGGTETQIADNYSFSTSAPLTDDIGHACFYSPLARGAAKLENHVIYPTPDYASIESQTTVYPKKSYDVLHNPGMGWVYYDNAVSNFSELGSNGTYPEIDNIGIVSTWAELEPGEGIYNWSKLDNAINYWSGQGKRIHLRVSTETTLIKAKEPFTTYNAGVPQWVYNLGVSKTIRKVDGYDCDFPDYNNSIYIQKMTGFVNALANRYKNNEYIDIVDLRGYGTGGGWNSGYNFTSLANRQQKLAEIIDIWTNAWGNSKILVLPVSKEWRNNASDPNVGQMVPAEPTGNLTYDQYLQYNAIGHALSKTAVALRFDSMSGGLRDVEREILLKFFRSNRSLPILYDFAGTYPLYMAVGGYKDSTDMTRKYNPETAYEDAVKNHPTYITLMGKDRFGDAKKFYDKRGDIIKKGNLEIGYRFVLNKMSYPDKIEAGSTFTINQNWSNLAFGRCYKQYPLKVYLTQADGTTVWSGTDTNFNQTGFIKDESYNILSHFNLDAAVPNGTYDLRIAMVDSSGNPKIKLAIQGMDSQMRYRIGKITVGSKIEGFENGSFAASDFNAGWQNSYGTIASDAARKVNGNYSAYGTVNSTDAWYEFLYSDVNKVKLDAGAKYEVTFKGKTIINFANGGYGYFVVRTATGGVTKDVGLNTWTDISGSTYTKTFTFTLKNYSDYYLIWGIRNKGAVSIDDIKIKKISGSAGEGFETGNYSDTRFMAGAAGGAITSTAENVASGAYSAYGNAASTTEWAEYLQTDPSKYALEANAVYSVTFKYLVTGDLGSGGNFYFYAYSPTGGHVKDKGDFHWFDKAGYGVKTKTVILSLGNYSDYRFIWGIHNGGAIAIDDIQIRKLENAQYEGLEGGNINSSGLRDAWAGYTLLNNQYGVINGTYSIGPNMNGFMLYTTGYEFIRTDSRRESALPAGKKAIYLNEDTTYTINFRVKQISDGKPGSYNYVVARSDMTDPGISGLTRWSTLASLSETDNVTLTFRTNYHYMYDVNDYYYVWGICNSGYISIDEIIVTMD